MHTLEERNPSLDDRDLKILKDRVGARNQRQGPRLGDFVYMVQTDKMLRFTHDWGGDIQTTLHGLSGSFYLTSSGGASYSGSLDSAIPKNKLKLISGEKPWGPFWFFRGDHARAHNGVTVQVPCRLYHYEG